MRLKMKCEYCYLAQVTLHYRKTAIVNNQMYPVKCLSQTFEINKYAVFIDGQRNFIILLNFSTFWTIFSMFLDMCSLSLESTGFHKTYSKRVLYPTIIVSISVHSISPMHSSRVASFGAMSLFTYRVVTRQYVVL